MTSLYGKVTSILDGHSTRHERNTKVYFDNKVVYFMYQINIFIHYDDASENRHPPSTKHHETRARTIVSKQSARLVIAPKTSMPFVP